MKRRDLLAAMLVGAATVELSGCLTYALRESRWQERVDAVLMSSDMEKIAFVGSDYDYVFADAHDLAAVIGSSIHSRVTANVSMFDVDRDNAVYGSVTLWLSEEDEDVEAEAISLGFQRSMDGRLSRGIRLVGKRYRKNPDIELLDSYRLNKSYTVPVTAPRSWALLLLSPLTVAADGVLLLAAVPVVVVAISISK
ncbi:hypothetical protein [Coralloluteibacterium thermophilus]|uniref:5-formyltetrahydrofolate cyclo-ligase n=1 Tax=Coralloluteibacterium thermophilum TaxID=2707049 RepID=A0ABV9NN93_9GAMM